MNGRLAIVFVHTNGVGRCARKMKLLYVYKLNFQDPTELALRKWLAREYPDTHFFCFSNEERSRDTPSSEPTACLPRFKELVLSVRPTHVFCWVPYLNEEEVSFLKKQNISVSMAVNGVTSFTSGICVDQEKYFDCLRQLDFYFVPHAPHVKILREQKINAVELPFCYDPDAYRPLSALQRCGNILASDCIHIGNFGPKENLQGKYRAEVVRGIAAKYSTTVVCDRSYREHDFTGAKFFRLPTITNQSALNWLINRSLVSIALDYFPNVADYHAKFTHVHTKYDTIRDAFVVRPRSIWSMGAGSPLIVERYPEIQRYFEDNEEILLWGSLEEAIEKIDRLKRDASFAKKIATNGQRKVLHLHSASVRLRQIRSILSGGTIPEFTQTT